MVHSIIEATVSFISMYIHHANLEISTFSINVKRHGSNNIYVAKIGIVYQGVSFMSIVHVHVQSSLHRQVLEASTRDFHLARSAATPGAVSMVRPLLSRSFRAVLRQVSFGRPLFLYVNQFQKSSRFVNLVCVASVVFVYQDQITTKIPKTIFLFHYAEKHKNSAKVLWPDLIKIGCAAIDSWYILKSVGMYKYTALKRDHITS